MDAVQVYKSGLENSTKGLERTLNGMTEDELNWHPKPDANSIGLILFHMARSEDAFINGFILGKKQLWETAKWNEKLGKAVEDGGAHYTAEEVEKWEMPALADIHAYTDAVRAQTIEYLDTLTPEKLDVEVTFPEGNKPPFDPKVGSLLLLNLTHLAQHAGEISYIRGLKHGMDK